MRASAPDSLYLEQAREEAVLQLVQLEKHLLESGLAGAQCRLVLGVPSEQINAQAREMAADLIVMGTHGRQGWSRLRFGSIAEAVLRQAPCSVLAVKTPKFEPGHRRVLPQAVE